MNSLKAITLFTLALMNLSMASNASKEPLSNYDDFLEQTSNQPEAMIRVWRDDIEVPSHSQWMCFSTKGMTLVCTEHELEEVIKTPMVAVYKEGQAFEIETSPIDEVDCKETIAIWEELLENEESFCVLSAYLQDLGDSEANIRSLRIIDALKTWNGYWMTPSLLEKLN